MVGRFNPEHVVQLFDDVDSCADAVLALVEEALTERHRVLLVCTREHWHALATRLRDAGMPFEQAMSSGRLAVYDAADTLSHFMRGGRPDRELFHATVGNLVTRLNADGTGLAIYGEMVDLLAREGELRAAQQLEDLWNELAARHPFTLLCGYSSSSFGDPQTKSDLQVICRSHTHVRCNPRDALGSFLVGRRTTMDASGPAD